MSPDSEGRPGQKAAPQATAGEDVPPRVEVPGGSTPAQAWAAAWLDGPHTEPGCRTCAAGWGLLDIDPRVRGVNAHGRAAGAIGGAP